MQSPWEWRMHTMNHCGSGAQVWDNYNKKVKQTSLSIVLWKKKKWRRPSNVEEWSCDLQSPPTSSQPSRSTSLVLFPKGPTSSWAALHYKNCANSTKYSVWQGLPSSYDDKPTIISCSTWATLITWCQVHQNFMVSKSPPSSCDTKSVRIFCSKTVRPHHIMPAKSTWRFCLTGSTLITWCRVHTFTVFDIVHPHHVMPSAAQEYFIWNGPHSSCDAKTTILISKTVRPHHMIPSPQDFLLNMIHPHHVMASSQELLRCLKLSILIMWCQVHKIISSDMVHPHITRIFCQHDPPSSRDAKTSIFWQGPPSWRNAKSTRIVLFHMVYPHHLQTLFELRVKRRVYFNLENLWFHSTMTFLGFVIII